MSKRGIEENVETLFGVPIALRTIANVEREASVALDRAYQDARRHVAKAAVKHIDETGWKEALALVLYTMTQTCRGHVPIRVNAASLEAEWRPKEQVIKRVPGKPSPEGGNSSIAINRTSRKNLVKSSLV